MSLLTIWASGLLTPVIIGIGVLGTSWFWYQAWRAHKSGGIQQGVPGNFEPKLDGKKTPLGAVHKFWFGVIILALTIAVLLIIASDYRGLK
jgi:hypothetical protein